MNSSNGILSFSNKYSYWHPVYKSSNVSIVNGLSYIGSVPSGIGISIIGKSYGRWYWEVKMITYHGGDEMFGITSKVPTASNIDMLGHVPNSVGIFGQSWLYSKNIGGIYATFYTPGLIGTSDVWGMSIELNGNSNRLDVYKNGSVYAPNIGLTSGTWYAANTPNGYFSTNFGQYAFSYTPPAGYSKGLFNPIYSRLDQNKTANGGILTNNNSTFIAGSNAFASSMAQVGKTYSKWYWEVNPTAGSQSFAIGVADSSFSGYVGSSAHSWCWIIYTGGANLKMNYPSYSTYGSTYGVGDYIGVALDMDGGNITMYKNGVSQGLMFSGLTGTMYPIVSGYMAGSYGPTPVYNMNFGATAFQYPAPAGYIYGLYI